MSRGGYILRAAISFELAIASAWPDRLRRLALSGLQLPRFTSVLVARRPLRRSLPDKLEQPT